MSNGAPPSFWKNNGLSAFVGGVMVILLAAGIVGIWQQQRDIAAMGTDIRNIREMVQEMRGNFYKRLDDQHERILYLERVEDDGR